MVIKIEKRYINKKRNIWAYVSVILGILLIISWIKPFSSGEISKDEVKYKALEYINSVLQGQAIAEINSIKEKNNLYELEININGELIKSYITKDGSLLFPNAIDLSKELDIPNVRSNVANTETKKDISIDDDTVKGDKNASVTIIEFSDFECPFCVKFYSQTLPQIEEEYIKTGKVKFVYRDFPLSSHANAQKAAEAAECADEQGKFWEMHDLLFEKGVSSGASSFKEYAEELGLNTKKFSDCLDSGKYEEEVQKDFADGQSYGVSGTPAFFINGIELVGAQPFSAFQQIIEQELSKSSNTIEKDNNLDSNEDIKEDIRIPISEIREEAKWMEYNSGETTIKFFAVKADDGSIKTGFDACDVCYGSRKGYRQEGRYMICNNCGNKYPINGLGTENKNPGGCWPGYLPNSVDGNEVIIKISDIEKGKWRFS